MARFLNAAETNDAEWSSIGPQSTITSTSIAVKILGLILELGDMELQGCSGGFKLLGTESGSIQNCLVRLSATLDAHTFLTEISLDGVHVEIVHERYVGD
jgi:hypothetical protein